MLLRGTTIQNTDYIIGCAVYTGKDTKSEYSSQHNYSEKVL